jgi:hypothetical protein
MKIGALIALILALLAMALSLVQYALFLFEIHNPVLTKILWPVSVVFHGLPLIVLCTAILLDRRMGFMK